MILVAFVFALFFTVSEVYADALIPPAYIIDDNSDARSTAITTPIPGPLNPITPKNDGTPPPPTPLLSPDLCNSAATSYVCSAFNGALWTPPPFIDLWTHTIRCCMTLNGVARGTATGEGYSSDAGPQYNPLYVFGNVTGNGDSGGFGKVIALDKAASDLLSSGTLGQGLVALDAQYIFGTGAGTGNRIGLRGIVNQTGPVAAPKNPINSQFLTGVFGQVYSNSNCGGTSASYLCNFYGVASLAELKSGATFIAGVQAAEFDVSVQKDASTAARLGLNIVRVNGDAVQGVFEDCAVCFTVDGTSINTGTKQSLAPWKVAFELARPDGYWSWSAATDFFHAATDMTGSGTDHPLNAFINLPNVSFTTAAVILPGFTIDPIGITSAPHFVALAGAGYAYIMGPNASIEDMTDGASTMYFDVSTGGARAGEFFWRTANSFTIMMSLTTTGLTVAAPINAKAYSVGDDIGATCSGVPTSSHRTANGITIVC